MFDITLLNIIMEGRSVGGHLEMGMVCVRNRCSGSGNVPSFIVLVQGVCFHERRLWRWGCEQHCIASSANANELQTNNTTVLDCVGSDTCVVVYVLRSFVCVPK
ncbi:uncharacterized protein TM35_001251000 [Trypanosoma theileri]|uniref:Uncharacterized protein n=1 Tax=Trypanosoma theileri TaxID=67003 RepID=A0A1X0NDX8_9TRYP|nr:uncharacterized protein TM35_001251000 [Trypanosoma theileri]ORC81205.1 hypothetical protein TM35_001251000 [Trypanosoma theileri]